MNQDLSVRNGASDRALFKKLSLTLTLSLFLILSLYVFLFAPLYVWFSNDVLYMGTVLPDMFDLLCSASDVFVFGIFYGILLYSLYRFTLKRSLPLLWIYVGAVFYKNVGNLLMTYATDGFAANELLSDLGNILLYILFELLQTALIVTIGALIMKRAKEREEIRRNAAVAAKKVYTPGTELLPFTRLLSFKNPLQKAAFWMAFVPMTVHVLQRAFYDVFYTIDEGFYGNPLIDILWMILYYIIDVVAYGVIVYFIELFILMQLEKTEKKMKSTDSAPADDLILHD